MARTIDPLDVVLPTPDAARPQVRRIGVADLRAALRAGVDDFRQMPTHLILLVLIYPVMGFILARWSYGAELLPLIFPLVSGFALVGPFAAVGLYELSRRREAGHPTTWRDAFGVFRSPQALTIGVLGGILLAILVAWLFAAIAIHGAIFGDSGASSPEAFARQVLTTPEGWTLILVGNAVGFGFAAVTLAVSAVSFPLALDRAVDPLTAIRTSVAAIIKNPVTMALWGAVVGVGLLLGALPFFTGLAVVMPILGHATWHLYRRVVV